LHRGRRQLWGMGVKRIIRLSVVIVRKMRTIQ
jgi:hypothetical protein